jgi:drug/metabolite transporter (DMT)-like permease
MISITAVAVVLLGTFLASVLVERVLGRSRRDFQKPGWYVVFFGVFVPTLAVVYVSIPIEHPFVYAAYGLCGSVASLIAQGLYGRILSTASQPALGLPPED